MTAPDASLDGAIFERSPIGMVVWRLVRPDEDASLVLIRANSRAAELLDRELSAEIGRPFLDVFPRSTAARRARYAEVARSGARFDDVAEAGPPGSLRAFSIAAVPVGGGAVLVCFQDFTRHQRIADEASRLGRFLDSIVESLPLMVFVKDAERLCFQRMNRAGEELVGLPREALLGKSDYDFFPKEQADAFVDADRATLRAGRVVDISEEPIQTANGERWLHTKKVPILDEAGRPLYLLGISDDITERREASAKLRAAKEAAEAATQELQAFSYSVAHDLRTPLRAIYGFSQVISESYAGKLDDDGLHLLSRIQRGCVRMGQLIDDLLELARVTRTQPELATVDVSDLARAVVAEHMAKLGGREVEITVRDGMVARADARLLRIVLENLVGNAFKFTSRLPRAKIEVGSDEGVFFVQDDGIGFDMAHATKLFSAFERLHPHEGFEGSGIGLALVQRIVARHGGRVWAEGRPGAGVVVRFTLAPR